MLEQRQFGGGAALVLARRSLIFALTKAVCVNRHDDKASFRQRQPRRIAVLADADGGLLAQVILAAVFMVIKHGRRRILNALRQNQIAVYRVADAVGEGEMLQLVCRLLTPGYQRRLWQNRRRYIPKQFPHLSPRLLRIEIQSHSMIIPITSLSQLASRA